MAHEPAQPQAPYKTGGGRNPAQFPCGNTWEQFQASFCLSVMLTYMVSIAAAAFITARDTKMSRSDSANRHERVIR